MKILGLSLDKFILNKNSAPARRMIEYGNLTERYEFVVPEKKINSVVLSDKVTVHGLGGINKIISFFKIFFFAKKLLQGGQFDLISVQDQYYLALIGYFLAARFKLGLELQIHGFENLSQFRKMLAKFVIPRAGSVRTVSIRLKKFLIDEFKVKEEKITVVPILSEDINIFTFNNKQKNSDNFIFLTVSRLVAIKNIGMQINALSRIAEKFPNAQLWIVGEGNERKNLKEQIERLNLKERVILMGWQDDLSNFYCQADAYLLTSDYEGWGLSVIEAAKYGLPIIMTDVGCAGEVIINGESGIVIRTRDENGLVSAMKNIITDEKLRAYIAGNANEASGKLPTKEETLNLYKKSWEIAIKYKLT